MRACSTCKQETSDGEFPPRRQQCRDCKNAYFKAYRAEHPDRTSAYLKRNAVSIKKKKAAYYQANKGRFSAWHKDWMETNPDQFKAKKKAWRVANADSIAAKQRAYIKTNRDQIRVYEIKRRIRVADQLCTLHPVPADEELVEWQDGNCYICGEALETDLNLDHFIPIRNMGKHGGCNVALSHKSCNSSKHARDPADLEIAFLPTWLIRHL